MLEKKESNQVVKALEQWFAEGFIPEKIVSDNGGEFMSEQFRNMCSVFGIEHVNVSVESYRSNGRVERSIRTFRDYIAKLDSGNIYADIDKFTTMYNNTFHSNIMRTPNEALKEYLDVDLIANNRFNQKMRLKGKNKSIDKAFIGTNVRICGHDNVDKSKKGRFLSTGKFMHIYENGSALIMKADSGRMIKCSESNIKAYATACEGDFTP